MDAPEVDNKLLLSVHDAAYIKAIEDALPALEADESRVLIGASKISDKPISNDEDTGLEGSLDTCVCIFRVYNMYSFVSCGTMKAAKCAAGTVCEAIKLVVSGAYKRAFCAVRPPGHHAGKAGRTHPAISQGFCIINNVAIGAKYAVDVLGCKRVAVVDLDVVRIICQ